MTKLKLLLTEQIPVAERLTLISELEELLETLFTDTYTVSIDLHTEENGNIERTLTIVTTETIEVAEEQPIREEVEEESSNDNGDSNGGSEDPEPEPEPEPPQQDPPSMFE